MKKILIIMLTFFSFFSVINAKENVYIESIDIEDKTTTALQINRPKYEGLNIKFDITLSNINDFIKYKVVINNDSNIDYEIDNFTVFKNSEYLKYEYIFNDNNKIVKKNTKTTIFIKISYIKEVPVSKMNDNGTFIENNSINIVLSDEVVNPKTGPFDYALLISIALASTLVFYFVITKSSKPITFIIFLLILIIPSSYAINKIQINVETKVTIQKPKNVLEARYTSHSSDNYILEERNVDNIPEPTERDFWQYHNRIQTVTFKDDNQPIDNYDYKFDVSERKNGSIIAYVKENNYTCTTFSTGLSNTDSNSCFDVYIVSNEKIYANEDSSFVFAGMINLSKINGIENYDTTYALNMKGMFANIGTNSNISSLNTDGITRVSAVSFGSEFEINLSTFNTSNVEDMSYMFYNNSEIFSLNLSSFDTSKVKNMSHMFDDAFNIMTLNISNFDTSNVEDMSYMFYRLRKLQNLNITSFNTSKVKNMSYMFSGCSTIVSLDLSGFNTENVKNMSHMFYECSKITSLDVSHFDTVNVTDMSYMFDFCSSLTSLNLSHFNTSNVEDMSYMFKSCSNLESLDVSSFVTSKVKNMSNMFDSCNKIVELNLSHFDTKNVTTFSEMFSNCNNLSILNVSHFDTRSATTMHKMFSDCGQLTSLDISSFNTSKVENMSYMFINCGKLESLVIGSLDTSQVTNMASMFSNCKKLTSLDISSFNTSQVINMSSMFDNMVECREIFVGNAWSVENVTSSYEMFNGDIKLRNYNNNIVDKTNANTSSSGYLTLKSS